MRRLSDLSDKALEDFIGKTQRRFSLALSRLRHIEKLFPHLVREVRRRGKPESQAQPELRGLAKYNAERRAKKEAEKKEAEKRV